MTKEETLPIEWVRRTGWTAEVEVDFFARLRRARPERRPQHLRIQAVHLREAGGSARARKALELLDRLLTEYPESIEVAVAHWCRSQCLADLGDIDGAVHALRAGLAVERSRPNVRTGAYLDLGMLAIRHGRTALYGEALATLDEFGGSEFLPRQQYAAAAIRAVALDAQGASGPARDNARLAIEAARRKASGLRYHPRLGLVTLRDAPLHAELRRIAGGDYES